MIGVQKLLETFSLHRMQQAFCRGAVSLRFRSKEQGMTVKDTFHFSRGQILKKSRSSSFLCLSLLRNHKETVTTQAKRLFKICFLVHAFLVCSSSRTLHLYIARSGAISTSRRSYQIRHSEPVCFIECICSVANLKRWTIKTVLKRQKISENAITNKCKRWRGGRRIEMKNQL